MYEHHELVFTWWTVFFLGILAIGISVLVVIFYDELYRKPKHRRLHSAPSVTEGPHSHWNADYQAGYEHGLRISRAQSEPLYRDED